MIGAMVPPLLPGAGARGSLPVVQEFNRLRIGTALRSLAEDLVAERQRAALLEAENKELRTELERIRFLLEQRRRSGSSLDSGCSPAAR